MGYLETLVLLGLLILIHEADHLRVPLTVVGLVLLTSVMVYANVHDMFRWLA